MIIIKFSNLISFREKLAFYNSLRIPKRLFANLLQTLHVTIWLVKLYVTNSNLLPLDREGFSGILIKYNCRIIRKFPLRIEAKLCP